MLKKGVSLVEILISALILSTIILLIGSLYLAHFRIFSNQNSQIDVSSQTRLAIDDIVTEVRESESVVSTCPACGGDTTSSSVLVLRLWPLDAAKEPFEPGVSTYDYIVYRRGATDQTKITKKILPHATSTRTAENRVLATSISNLTFAYNDPDPALVSEITITVDALKTAFGKNFTSTQDQKVALRNKQ